ncbi:MAG: J domain-containing protein [Microthrixaceae bacterium]
MTGDDRTHYQVLGVPRHASKEQIRRAHRQLAHLLHPDRQAGAGPGEQALAERRMREVNAAWTVLSDPGRRADYDRTLDAARAGAGSSSPSPSAAPHRAPVDPRDEDPDAWYAAARAAEVDPDEPDLHPAHFWLLRRGPVLALLALGLALFLFTAVAGRGGGPANEDAARATTPPPVNNASRCIARQDDGSFRTVGCEYPHVAEITLRGVTGPQACRASEEFLRLATNEGVCVEGLTPSERSGDGS